MTNTLLKTLHSGGARKALIYKHELCRDTSGSESSGEVLDDKSAAEEDAEEDVKEDVKPKRGRPKTSSIEKKR